MIGHTSTRVARHKARRKVCRFRRGHPRQTAEPFALWPPSVNRKNRHVAIALVTRFASSPLFLLPPSRSFRQSRKSLACVLSAGGRRTSGVACTPIRQSAAFILVGPIARQTGREGRPAVLECKSPAFRESLAGTPDLRSIRSHLSTRRHFSRHQ